MELKCDWCREHVGFRLGSKGEASFGICAPCGAQRFPEQFGAGDYSMERRWEIFGLGLVLASAVLAGFGVWLLCWIVWG